MNHVHLMRRAVELSMENAATAEGGPFGAIIVDRYGHIVGEGKNRVTRDNDPTAHGEVVAIRDACQALRCVDLSGYTLYTSSEPCPMCATAIRAAGISAVYYANTREDAAAIGFADVDLDQRPLDIRRLEDPNAIKAFMTWAANPNRETYFERSD